MIEEVEAAAPRSMQHLAALCALGLAARGTKVHDVAFGCLEVWQSCALGKKKATSNSHFYLCCQLNLGLESKWEKVGLGPFLQSGVDLWLCLYLILELCI